MEYSVIGTSGWQGAGWHLRGTFDSRAAAQSFADTIQQPNARNDDYIVAVVGAGRFCDHHDPETCWIFDTSRVKFGFSAPHLVSRRCHVTVDPIDHDDEDWDEVAADLVSGKVQ